MKFGSFNKVILLNYIVIKIENINSDFANNIKNMVDSMDYKTYYHNLKKIGINVAPLYFNLSIFGKNVQIVKMIKGMTMQQFMENQDVKVEEKVKKIKCLLLIYKKTLKDDVCIDLNMQNFIILKNNLVYIDFIPALYKSNIKKLNHISDYLKSYLDVNLAMCNLINYILRSMLYLDRNNLTKVFCDVSSIINEIFNIKVDTRKNKNCILLQDYMKGKLELEQYEKEYQKNKKFK